MNIVIFSVNELPRYFLLDKKKNFLEQSNFIFALSLSLSLSLSLVLIFSEMVMERDRPPFFERETVCESVCVCVVSLLTKQS